MQHPKSSRSRYRKSCKKFFGFRITMLNYLKVFTLYGFSGRGPSSLFVRSPGGVRRELVTARATTENERIILNVFRELMWQDFKYRIT